MLKNKKQIWILFEPDCVSAQTERKLMFAYYSLEASRDSSGIDLMCDLCNKCPQNNNRSTHCRSQECVRDRNVWEAEIRENKGENTRFKGDLFLKTASATFPQISLELPFFASRSWLKNIYKSKFFFPFSSLMKSFQNDGTLTWTHTVQLKSF